MPQRPQPDAQNRKDEPVPHIVIKMMPGRSDAEKQQLSDAIVATVMKSIGATEDSISVAIEDVAGRDWDSKVFEADIRGNKDRLFKKPGYKQV